MLPLKHEGAFEEAKKIQKVIDKAKKEKGRNTHHTLESSNLVSNFDPETIPDLCKKLMEKSNKKDD